MSELLKTLKGIRIKTHQFGDEDTISYAKVRLNIPKRRYIINVNRKTKDSSDEGHLATPRTTRGG